jgi:enamine deaminase RidA (YjgF/YER057c/UK114 family)
MAPTPTERLASLRLELPPPPRPAGSYAPAIVDGSFVWVSGQIVVDAGAAVHPGSVGGDVTPEVARELCRKASLQALSAAAQAAGSLDRIRRIVRVVVYVASAPGFVRQHEVANGATEILQELFGDAGRPARAAVGVVALPLNAPVEVELIAALA